MNIKSEIISTVVVGEEWKLYLFTRLNIKVHLPPCEDMMRALLVSAL